MIPILHMHTVYLHTLDLTKIELSFGEGNVTLRVTLEMMQDNNMIDGLIYGVVLTSLFEEVAKVLSDASDGNGSSIEMIMLYNAEYNLSTFTSLCGFENQSYVLSLFYGELSYRYYY